MVSEKFGIIGEEKRIEGLLDSDKRLDHNSWTIGGTHVTNFSHTQLEAYLKSVEEYGDENLIISGFAYNYIGQPIFCCSLHTLNPGTNLSDFWKILQKNK